MLHDSTFTRWKCSGNTGPLVAQQAHHLPRPPPTPASGEGTGGRKGNTRHGGHQAPASKGAPLAKAPLKVPALNAAVEGGLAVTPDTAHRPSGRLECCPRLSGAPRPQQWPKLLLSQAHTQASYFDAITEVGKNWNI